MKNIYDYPRESLEDYFVSINEKRFKATQVYEWLYEKKNSDGEIEKKEYPDPTSALDIAKKYVNYLEEGNISLDVYTKLMPNAQDIPDVLNMISQNNERIQSKKAEFSIQ